MLFSPSRGTEVGHNTYDHTSILKMVEWRFGLTPLTARDRAARNLAEVLDFSNPQRVPPPFTPVVDPGPHICVPPVGTNPMVQEEQPIGSGDPASEDGEQVALALWTESGGALP